MRRVAVFDAYGTLFDTATLAARAEAEAPGQGEILTRLWRSKQLEYTWLVSLMGRYRDFWTVTRDALDFTCDVLQVQLTEEARERLMEAFLELPAFPDAEQALAELTSRGVRCCVFSNGTRRMVEAAAASSGLARYLDAVLTVDEEVRVYKPSPAAYDYVCRRLGITPGEAVYISSNGFDVAGAASYGFPTAWVNRLRLPAERLGVAVALVSRDLRELARSWM